MSFEYPGNSNAVCTVLQKWHLHTTVIKTRNTSNINKGMEADGQGWVGSLNFQMDLFMLRYVKRNLVSIPFPISHHTINVEMKYFAYWLKII